MAKYLMLKHYRGAPPAACVPMDQWSPTEVDAHITYMGDFAQKLQSTGEFVDAQAVAPEGMWVRYSEARAIELAGELSAAPGPGGEPIHEWIEIRPFLALPETFPG